MPLNVLLASFPVVPVGVKVFNRLCKISKSFVVSGYDARNQKRDGQDGTTSLHARRPLMDCKTNVRFDSLTRMPIKRASKAPAAPTASSQGRRRAKGL